MEIRNAKIESTMLGIEDHGLFTCNLSLDYGRAVQGFGGFCLDDKPEKSGGDRTPSKWGCYVIMRILRVVGASEWEDLLGKHVRVQIKDDLVYAIGHILKDQWFCPTEEFKKYE